MKASVAAGFTAYQAKFEGVLPFLYLDVKGLVTCAIGLLVDPVELALPLPWQIGDYPATQQEIQQQWGIVKQHRDWAPRGGVCFGPLTTIRLSDAAVNTVTLQKAAQMEDVLRRDFMDYDAVPADAQLGLLSMSWALGPAFAPGWPLFTAAFREWDFGGCAAQCQLSTVGNPGVAPRNVATSKLFEAARCAYEDPQNCDPDVLHGWP